MPSDETLSQAGLITFGMVVDAYLDSPKFKATRPNTQGTWRRYLMFACRHLRNVPIDAMHQAIDEFFDGLATRPGIAKVTLSAIRAVEKFARKRRYITQPFTFGIELEQSDGGHLPWTAEQVEFGLTQTRAPWPTIIALGAYTGQRGSDLVRLGWNDIEDYEGRKGFALTQVKTGRKLWVPIVAELEQIMTTWERRPGPFILNHGRPWSRAHMSAEWNRYQRRYHRELAGLVLHGLRGHACVRLYRAGCTTREVAEFVGMSLPMVERYCRLSVQKENAMAAVIRLEGRKPQQNQTSNILRRND